MAKDSTEDLRQAGYELEADTEIIHLTLRGAYADSLSWFTPSA